MKIKLIKLSYSEVLNRKPRKLRKPKKVSLFWKILIKIVSFFDLKAVKFKCNKININKPPKKQPCLILMNHSSFLDMEIAYSILWNKNFNVVTTSDAFIGKNWLLRQIGCFPTIKFLNDPLLVRNIVGVIKKKRSVLLYPEAGYTFDGTATTIPYALAKLVKFLKVPLVTIITQGVHLRQPLFNKLRKRKVPVKCDYKYLLSVDDINKMTEDEIFSVILKEFSFDNYQYQIENKIIIDEKERADNLNVILYKCPHCKKEGVMDGHDNIIECQSCGIKYELTNTGLLECMNGKTMFDTIPKWYNYQRSEVKKEVELGKYHLETEVQVIIMKDTFSLYDVGKGYLTHNINGFNLKLNDSSLNYNYSSTASYSLNADIYWYQLGDIICIGDYNIQYYCIPTKKDVVVKSRLATEEIYKLLKDRS